MKTVQVHLIFGTTLVSNDNTMFATDSELPLNGVWNVWYVITILKLSGLIGIRAHVKRIRIIMEKFQPQSQRRSRYIVHSVIKQK